MQDFHELRVWQKAHALTLAVYRTTVRFPKEENYGLTAQTRRAAASVPANIAEGCGRGTNAELRHFLQVALGSASELEYHLLLARDLGHLSKAAWVSLNGDVLEVKRMLWGLIGKFQAGRQKEPAKD